MPSVTAKCVQYVPLKIICQDRCYIFILSLLLLLFHH